MKKEYKYFGAILSVFLIAMAALSVLLRKYTLLTFQHFIETCQQVVTTFFSSGVHFVGLTLVLLTLLLAVIFCVKTIFSLVKTQRKIDSLLEHRLDVIPNKLKKVLRNIQIREDKVVVINRHASHAFNYGLKSRKIVLSGGLIDHLSSKQLEAVVLHELYHLDNKHTLLLTMSEILSSTLFFAPLLKELNMRMRVTFEKQADLFAINVQGTKSHLNKALLTVPNSRMQFYPGFSMRRQHDISRKSVLGSVFTTLVTIALFLFPIDIHATEFVSQPRGNECMQSQCATHCPTENMSRAEI